MKAYEIRYSGQITYEQMKNYFYSQNILIDVYFENNKIELKTPKSTYKINETVKEELIEIIELNKN